MSGDYISRDDIGLTDFEIILCQADENKYKNALVMLLDKIEKLPAADVEERKTSFWRKDAISTNDGLSHVFGYRCYSCFGFCIGASKYCPNCGARMEYENGEH